MKRIIVIARVYKLFTFQRFYTIKKRYNSFAWNEMTDYQAPMAK